MPSLPGCVPRMLLTTQSAVFTSASNCARPSVDLRSSVTLFLPRFQAWKYSLSSLPRRYGPTWRDGSPSGASTLITSAPSSAMNMVPYGPAPNCSSVRTRMPANGFEEGGLAFMPMRSGASTGGR